MNLSNNVGSGFQAAVLPKFTVLWLLRQQWGGRLVLSCGLNAEGAALALATNIAGAVCLSIEPDAELLKGALRSGACDFAVNTLDEALRTMKNEVRKGLPLSVGLHGTTTGVLAEVLERGLLPVIAADLGTQTGIRESLSRLQAMGTQIVDFDGRKPIQGTVDAAMLLETEVGRRGWKLRCLPTGGRSELAVLDGALVKLVDPEDTLRLRWLQKAPLYFGRERPLCRAMWLSLAEEAGLPVTPG